MRVCCTSAIALALASFSAQPALSETAFAAQWAELADRCLGHLQGKEIVLDGMLSESVTKSPDGTRTGSVVRFPHDTYLGYGVTADGSRIPRAHCGLFTSEGVDDATFAETEASFERLAPTFAALGMNDLGTGTMSATIRFHTFGVMAEPRCAVTSSLRVETPPGKPTFPVFSTEVTGPGCTKLYVEAAG